MILSSHSWQILTSTDQKLLTFYYLRCIFHSTAETKLTHCSKNTLQTHSSQPQLLPNTWCVCVTSPYLNRCRLRFISNSQPRQYPKPLYATELLLKMYARIHFFVGAPPTLGPWDGKTFTSFLPHIGTYFVHFCRFFGTSQKSWFFI